MEIETDRKGNKIKNYLDLFGLQKNKQIIIQIRNSLSVILRKLPVPAIFSAKKFCLKIGLCHFLRIAILHHSAKNPERTNDPIPRKAGNR